MVYLFIYERSVTVAWQGWEIIAYTNFRICGCHCIGCCVLGISHTFAVKMKVASSSEALVLVHIYQSAGCHIPDGIIVRVMFVISFKTIALAKQKEQ
jgi:hypothetical protein